MFPSKGERTTMADGEVKEAKPQAGHRKKEGKGQISRNIFVSAQVISDWTKTLKSLRDLRRIRCDTTQGKGTLENNRSQYIFITTK